jgi:hypothetical protein
LIENCGILQSALICSAEVRIAPRRNIVFCSLFVNE